MSRIIVLSFNGPKVAVETTGFSGPSCTEASSSLMKAIGASAEGDPHLKDEFYADPGAQSTGSQQLTQEQT